ncbi:hypothetical protein [Flavobacterium sp. AG291]|uniref:hypothetical protein n=1 Tax=Flavobacterium sp. AG291 TaxID=2184000 RepID=UPI000E0B7EA6|nr:hypothetical protein [Flavobacterium sp. AG291]RDI09719.1 hypothetical protein DEU42_10915 [Flavobacterium sp. AG291]
MKYIVIKGAKSAGKAATIREVCTRLKPDAVKRIYISESGSVAAENVQSAKITEGNFVVTVRKKNILIVSASPTEQKKRITSIMESVSKLNIRPDFAIVSMCGLEKLKDFSTSKELESYGKCIYETKIWRIPSYTFNLTDEWNRRVSYLTAITLHNL